MTNLKIKGAIFDMDGTLVDSLMFWEEFWPKAGKKFLGKDNFTVGEEADKAVRTMFAAQAMPYVNGIFHFCETDKEFLDYFNAEIRAFYANVKIKSGAIELLDHLSALGVKMCVASATDLDNLNYAIKVCGLDRYFETTLSCADIGAGKDKPDIYIAAKNALGLDAEDICVFEDSYVALETAKKAGFQTVGIYDKYNYGQDRLEAASLIYIKDGEPLSIVNEAIFAK